MLLAKSLIESLIMTQWCVYGMEKKQNNEKQKGNGRDTGKDVNKYFDKISKCLYMQAIY